MAGVRLRSGASVAASGVRLYQAGNAVAPSKSVESSVVPSVEPATASSSFSTAQDFAHNEGDIARKWQEYMRDTAISSSIKQYRDAGLNPYASNFMQAVTPSTSSVGTSSGSSYVDEETQASAKKQRQESITTWISSIGTLMNGAGNLMSGLKSSGILGTVKKVVTGFRG